MFLSRFRQFCHMQTERNIKLIFVMVKSGYDCMSFGKLETSWFNVFIFSPPYLKE